MRVAYDSQIFSGQIYGGVSRYFCEIASRLANSADVDVKIAAPMYVNAYLEKLPRDLICGFHSPFPYDFLKLYQRATSMFLGDLVLRSLSLDIVHETYYFKYPLGPKKAGRVLTIYDMIHERFQSQFQYGDKTSTHKAVAAARAEHIICISESTKKDAIEILGLNPEKISVIPLGFDLMVDNEHINTGLPSEISKPFLLFVGTRGGYKNFLPMLQVYAKSTLLRSEFNLICFGGGSFNKDESLAIKKLGLNLDQVVHMSGDDQLLAQLYKNASAFVFPSLYEGFGIPPLEAMFYDCPVVCSNTSSIPEVVGDAGLYFNPYDADDMQTAIESVIQSNELRESLIAKGKVRLKLFSWDKCAAETLEVYKRLI